MRRNLVPMPYFNGALIKAPLSCGMDEYLHPTWNNVYANLYMS